MSKRIVICCDGTWNKPASEEDERVVPSNVLKLVRAVLPRDADAGVEQVVYYDAGVGTGTFGIIDKYVGGATGLGISRNIQQAYRFLANNYVEGDEVYFFGFSRGAYTVRSLSGLLDTVGLLDKSDLRHVHRLYAYYRTRPDKRSQSKYHELVNSLERRTIDITFMGVWDTVGALGVPTPMLGWLSRKLWVGFHDTGLSGIIRNAYQALAIDERRRPFAPAIWTRKPEGANVRQVWFVGSHRNVGGGYRDDGLSDVAFMWLANRARDCGLAFSPEYLSARVQPNPMAEMEDSFTGIYRALGKLGMSPLVRKIADLQTSGEMIHESVISRLRMPELDYRPENLIPEGANVDGLLREEDGHLVMDVHGAAIPVFKERQGTRIRPSQPEARLRIEGSGEQRCEIIDLNPGERGGARLRLEQPLEEGMEAYLEGDGIGVKTVRVVWSSEGVMGVHFAA